MKIQKVKYNEYSDELLMQEVIKGNVKAFSEIYDRYSTPVLNYFYKMLWQDREVAEDFMQDLFTKIIQKPNLFNPKLKFKTWLYSIAHNMCKNEYRKREVRQNSAHEIINHQTSSIQPKEITSQLDNATFSAELKKEIELLSSGQKAVFILRFKQHLSLKEIADVLDVSEGTVKSRLFYALKKLSAQLEHFNPILNFLLLTIALL